MICGICMVPVHMSHHHLPLSCSSAMTFLGLEPRIVFLPTSQLEYLQKSAVLDKKKIWIFNFWAQDFVLKIHSQASTTRSCNNYYIQEKTHITVLETTQEEIQGRDTDISVHQKPGQTQDVATNITTLRDHQIKRHVITSYLRQCPGHCSCKDVIDSSVGCLRRNSVIYTRNSYFSHEAFEQQSGFTVARGQYTTTPLHGHHRGTLYCCCEGNSHILVTTRGGGGGPCCCSSAAWSKTTIPSLKLLNEAAVVMPGV